MADGIYQLGLHGHDGQGNQWANFFCYNVFETVGDAPNVMTARDVILAWRSALESTYLACVPGDIYLRQYTCRCVTTATHSGTATKPATAPAGTRPTDSVSLNIGPQIAWYPTVDSRQVGKTFLPGIAAGDVVEGTIQTTLQENILTWATAMVEDLTLGEPGIGHGEFSIWKRSAGLAGKIVIGYLRARLGSQRKRTSPTF